MTRLLFQLRRWWRNRGLHRCPTCHGTGNEEILQIEGLLVIICRDCDGNGWAAR